MKVIRTQDGNIVIADNIVSFERKTGLNRTEFYIVACDQMDSMTIASDLTENEATDILDDIFYFIVNTQGRQFDVAKHLIRRRLS